MHRLKYKRFKNPSSKYISHTNPVSKNLPKKHTVLKVRSAAAVLSITAVFVFTRAGIISKTAVRRYLLDSTSISEVNSFASDAKKFWDKKFVSIGKIGESLSDFCFGYLHGRKSNAENKAYAKEKTSDSAGAQKDADKSSSKKNIPASSPVPVVPKFAYEFVYPCTGSITSPFGDRSRPTENASSVHGGIDIAVPEGADVYCAEVGIVEKTGNNEYSGNYVVVRHNAEYTTSYAHLSQISVSEGDSADKPTVIGKAGHTGIATGPHLHFEIRQNGNAVNPIYYLKR